MKNEEKDKLREEPLPEESQEQAQEPVGEPRESRMNGGKEKDRRKRKLAEQAEEIKRLARELEEEREAGGRAIEAAAEAKDQYLRLQAEWDNYRRRTAKERLELVDNAARTVLSGFLPVLDDCQRAMQVLHDSGDAQAAVEGTELIYNKLLGYLKQCGVERIEAVGAAFDTDFHEAVAQFPVEDPEKKNTVIDVVQEGYTLNGTVIRFAKVVVGI